MRTITFPALISALALASVVSGCRKDGQASKPTSEPVAESDASIAEKNERLAREMESDRAIQQEESAATRRLLEEQRARIAELRDQTQEMARQEEASARAAAAMEKVKGAISDLDRANEKERDFGKAELKRLAGEYVRGALAVEKEATVDGKKLQMHRRDDSLDRAKSLIARLEQDGAFEPGEAARYFTTCAKLELAKR